MKNRFGPGNQARIGAGLRMYGLVGILAGLLPSAASAATPCNAPPALKARLAARPSAQAYVDTGNWFADHKLFSCAADDFSRAAKLDPQSSSVAYLWGLSLYSAGHDEAALVPLRRAAKLDPAISVLISRSAPPSTGSNAPAMPQSSGVLPWPSTPIPPPPSTAFRRI